MVKNKKTVFIYTALTLFVSICATHSAQANQELYSKYVSNNSYMNDTLAPKNGSLSAAALFGGAIGGAFIDDKVLSHLEQKITGVSYSPYDKKTDYKNTKPRQESYWITMTFSLLQMGLTELARKFVKKAIASQKTAILRAVERGNEQKARSANRNLAVLSTIRDALLGLTIAGAGRFVGVPVRNYEQRVVFRKNKSGKSWFNYLLNRDEKKNK